MARRPDPRRRTRRWGQRGQAAVELALALPLLALLLLALLQLALVGRDVVLVTHAAREAARAAAVDADPDAARRAALAAGDLRPGRLNVEVSGRRGAGSQVTVSVSYRIPTEVPLVGDLLGDHRVTARATMRVETP